jgi:hypothetical protein
MYHFKRLTSFVLEIILCPFFFIAFTVLVLFKRKRNDTELPRLLWGADPIINNKYWSESLKAKGYVSKTLMTDYYSSINKKEDFDMYLHELFPVKLPLNINAYIAFLYSIYNFDIIHHPAHGFLLRFTYLLKKFEGTFIKAAGCKNVVLPYGADIWMYSKITNTQLRHALLLSYPNAGKNEAKIQRNINYWIRHSSVFFPMLQVDGVSYWDVLCYSNWAIDEKTWQYNRKYSHEKNGKDAVVKIIHTPNHRGVKGTEFIVAAVEDLKREGLKVELILLEKVANDVLKEWMDESDILAEQLIIAHGISAVEGMAKGLTVISNFEDETRNKVFRTYSYLNECPIVSASTENITDVLRRLVTNPQLRQELGIAGRAYVEKYHSYSYSQYLFGEIYRKIWKGEAVDLMNLFHPLNLKSYNHTLPFINHPLIKNKLPNP